MSRGINIKTCRTAQAAGFGLWLIAGCASQGPLHPPSLKLPAAVRGLTAERVGDAVELRWTAPTRTTDGVSLAGVHGLGQLTAELCRQAGSPPAATCTPIQRLPAVPGATGQFTDSLPAALRVGEPSALHYSVRVVNGRGRGGAAAGVQALAGSAPGTVHGLSAGRGTDGVVLRWQPEPLAQGESTMLRVTRGNPAGPGADATAPPGAKPSASSLLSVGDGDRRDPGGAVDRGAKPGAGQEYKVFRTRKVTLGGTELTMNGPAAAISVAANAPLPPPAAPAGLEALADTLDGSTAIDLVWQPSAGATDYRVYRSERDGEAVLLTATPQPGLTYSDKAVRPGTRYRYMVTAVGPEGAESRKSAPAVEEAPAR